MDALMQLPLNKDGFKRVSTKKGDYVVIPQKKDGTTFLTKQIQVMLEKGKNFVLIVHGRTRSGKSLAALRLAMEVDPNFKIERNVIFTAKEFMDLLKNPNLKTGAVILWDEIGTGKSMSSRNWYSILNKSVNYVLQTWGHRNLMLILTVPDISFVDSQTRKLCNARMETKGIHYHRGVTKARLLYTSPMGRDNIKTVKPRYNIFGKNKQHKGKFVVEFLEIKKPGAAIVNRYKKVKEKFTSKLNSEIQAELSQLQEKEQKEMNKSLSGDELIEIGWKKLKDEITLSHRGQKRMLRDYIIRSKMNIGSEKARWLKDKILHKANKECYPDFTEELERRKLKKKAAKEKKKQKKTKSKIDELDLIREKSS